MHNDATLERHMIESANHGLWMLTDRVRCKIHLAQND